MTHQEILQELLQREIIIENIYEGRKWKNKKNLELKNIIIDCEIADFNSFSEKIWYFMHLNKNPSRPKCEVCGINTPFLTIPAGFRKTCSQTCSGNSTSRKEKIKNTSLKKHGVEHPTQSQQFRDTVCERKKILGYHPGSFNSPEFKKAIFKKYGVDNVFQSPIIKEKIRLTLQQKYGVDNVLKSPIIKEKIRLTSQKRYGTDFPIQNAAIFEKCQKASTDTRYNFKELIMPSGDIRWVQGYEPQVIDYLLKSNIDESDLKTNREDIPVIKYEFENKSKVYFPDIFIPSKNMLIEVKSGYTWNKDLLKNLAKHEASKNAGFRHLIIIWDDSNDCIKNMIN